MPEELKPEQLRKECPPELIKCETTEQLSELKGIIGQKRAVKALDFGLNIKNDGFNVYVSGYPGTGRETAVKNFLGELAKSKPTPSDWIYVNNFENSYEPRAIEMPAGKGKQFRKDMNNLIEEVRDTLPKAFQSEDYAKRREETVKKFEEERNELLRKLKEKA